MSFIYSDGKQHGFSDTKYNAKVYFYTRPVEGGISGSIPQEVGGPNVSNRQPLKHWSIVIQVLDRDPEESLPGWFICEANNEEDLLWARFRRFKQEDRNKLGVEMKPLKDKESQREIFNISLNDIKTFCDAWNQKRFPYKIPSGTCQKFVDCLGKMLNANMEGVWNLEKTLTFGSVVALGAALLWAFLGGR